MTKKIFSQRELEQFMRELFEQAGKNISCQLKTSPKRYIVKVDGKEVSCHHVQQFKAYNDALIASGVQGTLAYKYNTKKDTPEWTYKDA